MNQMEGMTLWSKQNNLIGEMRSALTHLNKTEKKIARNILADPEAATHKSIAVLAKNSGVSEPSVNRFCKRFNTTGFPDFKLKLAKASVSGILETVHPLHAGDDADQYAAKIINNTIANLLAFRHSINYKQIQLVVDSLNNAKRVFIFGLGLSSVIAKAAESKFYQSGLFASFNDDLIMQRMIVSNSSPGDLFFLISQTGETKEIIEVAELAKLNNASIVSLSPDRSRIAKLSTLNLHADESSIADKLSISSLATYQVMLDIIVAGIRIQKNTSTRFLDQDWIKDCYKVI